MYENGSESVNTGMISAMPTTIRQNFKKIICPSNKNLTRGGARDNATPDLVTPLSPQVSKM